MKIFRSSRFVLVALSAIVCGCGHSTPRPPAETAANWLRDGMIAISRPVPSVSESPSTLLGFMPVGKQIRLGSWVSIDRASRLISIMEGDRQTAVLSGDGIDSLKPGIYRVLHKQKNALWYAPDSYFSARALPVPAQGDRSRFRRGALGEFVVYLDKTTPIHSGPVWSEEIGGARIDESELSRLYYSLDIGTQVEIR